MQLSLCNRPLVWLHMYLINNYLSNMAAMYYECPWSINLPIQFTSQCLAGVSKSNLVLDTVEKYDPKQDKWTSVSTLNTPRSGACAVVLQQSIYVLGGSGRRGAMSSCEVFDARRNTWKNIKGNTH